MMGEVLQPAVSVVMPLYNKENDVARAIRSALAQTFADFELIVVNDGSTDGSANVVRGFNDSRVRLIEQENAGVSAARNRGIAESKSDLVAFLDADDEWLPDFLTVCYGLHQKYPKAGICACAYYYQLPNDERSDPVINLEPNFQEEDIIKDYFRIASSSDPPLWTSAITVKKSLLQMLGGFPEGVGLGEDLLTWARLSFLAPIAYSRKPLAVYYRRSSENRIIPLRPPAKDDKVGELLSHLLNKHFDEPGLLAYVNRWHLMRLNPFAKLGMLPQAWLEFRKIVRHDYFNKRAWFWLFVAALPRYLAIPFLKYLAAKGVLR